MKWSFRKYRQLRGIRATVSQILSERSEIKLELGSGPVKGKNGWTTIDCCDESDIRWDLREPLPFPDNSIDAIYSSHVLEHFSYLELMRLLKDCLRVLKSGGMFSACVPDAEIYINGYFNFFLCTR